VFAKILEGEIRSGIYNIADDEPLSTVDLVRMIAVANGKKARILNVPKPIINVIAKTGNLLPLPLNEERLQKLTENYVVSNRKILEAIGCSLPVSAESGMRKTLSVLYE
jgi:nucleoside-diphosphate-sugar epimerase